MAIETKKSREGLFTKFANANNMSVAEAAKHVMDNKESYSPERVKQANFALNAQNFNHAEGDEINGDKDGNEVDGEGDGFDYKKEKYKLLSQRGMDAKRLGQKEADRRYYLALQSLNEAQKSAEQSQRDMTDKNTPQGSKTSSKAGSANKSTSEEDKVKSLAFNPDYWAQFNEGPAAGEIAATSAVPATAPDLPTVTQGQFKSATQPNYQLPTTTDAGLGIGTDGTNNGTNNPQGKGSGFDWGSALSTGLNYGLPAAQALIGYNQLKKLGPRPVGELDADFLNALRKTERNATQADLNARYGLSPEQQAQLKMENNALTNAGRYAARNLSGGNAATALNTERAVINDAFGRNLASRVQDKNLQLQKQAFAMNQQNAVNNMTQAKQEAARRLFTDKLGGWQQDQAAYGNLLNTGLTNALDAVRYDKFLKGYNKA